MNANSLPQTPVIKDWLINAIHQLSSASIASARLDAEIILAQALGKNRTYLHAHNDEKLDTQSTQNANTMLSKRLGRTPIAYIVGFKEFFGRKFNVNHSTLIPRPESEDIIIALNEILISQSPFAVQRTNPQLIDVGTGNGCLGITAKLEHPELEITLLDISTDALKVAKQNAINLLAEVNIIQSDLLQNIKDRPNIIIANLPYIDKNWDLSPEIFYEPNLALFAENHGMEIIKNLIVQASNSLVPDGCLIIEADPAQHNTLIGFANKHNLIYTNKFNYIVTFEKKAAH